MIIFLGSKLLYCSSDATRKVSGQPQPFPIRSCFGWGLPSQPVSRLLVRSYRTFPPLPRRRKLHIPRPAASGSSRSFRCASSPHKTFVLRGPHFWAAAVYLCCTFPQIALGGRYPLSLPCGARTFLMRGLSALRPRLSDPVAHVLYFICRKKSNRLQFLSHVDIIQAGIFSERLWI